MSRPSGGPTRDTLHARGRPRERAGGGVGHGREQIHGVVAPAARVSRIGAMTLPRRHGDDIRARCRARSPPPRAACRGRTSPRRHRPDAMPSRSAVAGLISTQLLHIADVSGSGISCSHGRCASEPSRKAFEGYGRKWNGYCSALAVELRRGKRQWGGRSRPPAVPAAVRPAGSVPDQTPFACASVHASTSGGRRGQAGKRRAEHLVECLPRQVERPAKRAARSRGARRASRVSGAAAAWRAAPRWPRPSWPRTRAAASLHDSRNE